MTNIKECCIKITDAEQVILDRALNLVINKFKNDEDMLRPYKSILAKLNDHAMVHLMGLQLSGGEISCAKFALNELFKDVEINPSPISTPYTVNRLLVKIIASTVPMYDKSVPHDGT